MATKSQFAVAIHILTLLSLAADEAITSEYIGGSVNTNPVFIRRILGMLSRAGLVTSQPGVGGGWRLVREPTSISLLDVYRAIEDDRLLSLPHSTPNPDCLIGRNIQRTLTVYFGEAERAFEQALAQQTIAQVLETASEDTYSQKR
ncbi:Rrf2 family transcriptional regulator [Ktedonosporobacter rubrisoli]|uniref:Rrf2 family transcriptional regulator n=1 Tax=Ktedonosporobacter rubrisoli TaxID=2509675 RepID=A0A4P6JJK6_KTERU|nr:Rrf2 family transcriptional regulator [Ktedonosporobacter rubrisoli]QBD75289.1 Rrf2 family transcriptional regulator [Ktedonosporobacter rubrisoli]